MTRHLHGRTSIVLAAGLALIVSAASFASAKDIGPRGACDSIAKGTHGWQACLGEAANLTDAELFYAGYWLAKSGHYTEALGYLNRASQPDERILTYIGFATRKLGDVDAAFGYYGRALALNPDYSVARAYLGDAFLTKGDLAGATGQLREIERRCGSACAEYAELSDHITRYRETMSPRG